MTDLRTAAQQALEVLTAGDYLHSTIFKKMDAIDALRAALAQQDETVCPYIRSTAEGTHHCALAVRQPLSGEET